MIWVIMIVICRWVIIMIRIAERWIRIMITIEIIIRIIIGIGIIKTIIRPNASDPDYIITRLTIIIVIHHR